MEMLTAWVFLAFVVEEAVEIIKRIFPVLKAVKISEIEIPLVLALSISLVIAFGANLDLFDMLNVQFNFPAVGPILSALLMTGGSDMVNKIKDRLKELREA